MCSKFILQEPSRLSVLQQIINFCSDNELEINQDWVKEYNDLIKKYGQ